MSAQGEKTDWEAIESAFRAGSLSVRAIAETHGITHAAISKRAKKEGWQRDLTEKVRSAAKAKATLSVTTTGNRIPLVTDEQIIDEASDVAASVIISHRVGLSRWRAIADKLCDALTDLPVVEGNIGDFSRALNAGVDAQLKVIKGERQAYNLDDDQAPDGVSAVITRVERVIIDAPKN